MIDSLSRLRWIQVFEPPVSKLVVSEKWKKTFLAIFRENVREKNYLRCVATPI